jgi:L-arabinokinase
VRIDEGEAFPDADAFESVVARHELFRPNEPVYIARAPGRLDVMGGIADYSGSLVLEMPITAAACAAAQLTECEGVVAVSGSRRLAVSARDLSDTSLDELALLLAEDGGWAAYVLGPIALLAREDGLGLDGLRVLVASDVPEGKGVSSSAAVELASIQAAAACLARPAEPKRYALIAQRAEHQLARAPCGVMDQMTAAFGEADRLLAVLCRPAEIVGALPLAASLAVWGIDSGVRHAVAGDGYRRARCATFMGKELLGLDRGDYLSECVPSQIAFDDLPERMEGSEFIRRYGAVADDVSVVEPDVSYPVRAATMHAIEEHMRVSLFAELVQLEPTDRRAELLGELMFQSHASYSRLGLGTTATDAIVDEVRRLGWRDGLIGARISGGGSGGTVAVLARDDAEPRVRAIAAKFGGGVVACSSDGAARFGIRVARAAVGG